LSDKTESDKIKVTISTTEKPIECRVTLQNAPVGSKLIAPCGCIGSQQWIQFAEFNRLRRKEPSQWASCQTCQQKFKYNFIQSYGGVSGNILALVLDNKVIIRSVLFLVSSLVLTVLSFKSLALRIFTSKVLWQSVRKIKLFFSFSFSFSFLFLFLFITNNQPLHFFL